MSSDEPQISDVLMSLAMEFRFLVIDEIRKIRPNIVVPQLRAGAGHHRSFSIVPGGNRTVTVHSPRTRQRTYEFFVVSVMDLFEAPDEMAKKKAARELGGIAPSSRHDEKKNRFTGDTDADPFRGRFSLGALYEVATAIRRGGNIPEQVSMEFEAIWNQEILSKVIVHLEYPEPTKKETEVFGRPVDRLLTDQANKIADKCLDKMRHFAEERFHLSPTLLEPFISSDKTGTQVFGIGMRRWLD